MPTSDPQNPAARHPVSKYPTGPSAPLTNLTTAISFARFVAVITAFTGVVGAVLLVAYTELGDDGRHRPFVGHAVIALGATLALVTILLVLAGWAETWLRAQRVAPSHADRPVTDTH